MTVFNLETYQSLISRFVRSGRQIALFTDSPGEGLLLRMDIDYDPAWAAETAIINHQLNISATYCVQVASSLYNPMTPTNRECLKKIVDCGQHIGLHFDLGGEAETAASARLSEEFTLLRQLVPEAQKVVSFHNPGTELSMFEELAVGAGLSNTYGARFFGKDRYVSDSNMRNGLGDIVGFVENNTAPLIQVLLHPINWVVGGDAAKDMMQRAFRYKFEQLQQGFMGNRVWRAGLGKKIDSQLRAAEWYRE